MTKTSSIIGIAKLLVIASVLLAPSAAAARSHDDYNDRSYRSTRTRASIQYLTVSVGSTFRITLPDGSRGDRWTPSYNDRYIREVRGYGSNYRSCDDRYWYDTYDEYYYNNDDYYDAIDCEDDIVDYHYQRERGEYFFKALERGTYDVAFRRTSSGDSYRSQNVRIYRIHIR